jgi:hypothetical protein
MARTFPRPTLCRSSLGQSHRSLWRCGARRSWDAFRQKTIRQNGDPLSSYEGTVSSSHHLSCILSFLVCSSGPPPFSACCYLFVVLSCLCFRSGFHYIFLASRKGARGLCSRTLIIFPTLLLSTPVNLRRCCCHCLFWPLYPVLPVPVLCPHAVPISELDRHLLPPTHVLHPRVSLELVHRLSLEL